MLGQFRRNQQGQALLEYALIIALIAVGLMTILVVLRNTTGNVYNGSRTAMDAAGVSSYGSAAANPGTGPESAPIGNGAGNGNAGGNGNGNGNAGGNGKGKTN